MYDLFSIGLAFILVFMNAFFVAAEFGMVKLRSTQVQAIKDTYGLRGRILEQVHSHLDSYLSACQLGITLASLGLGWVGEPAFAHLLSPLFSLLGISSPRLLAIISFFVAFFVISFLHIVAGELMPKSLAIRQSELISIWTAVPLYGFYWLTYPAIWILNSCSNFFLNQLGLDTSKNPEGFYSSDELKLILNATHLHGELNQEERDIIEHTLDLGELTVTEVMRPEDEMIVLNLDDSIETITQEILRHRYSRYPVFDKSTNQIVGIIHVKDLFAHCLMQEHLTNISQYLRPVLKVSYQLPAMDLLRKFREGMPHFALIYKNQSTLLGFVTLDNLLHVLIGRIKDEFHKTHDDWVHNPDGTITAKGECSIYSLERALDVDITLAPDEENLNTLNGLILIRNGKLPKVGDHLSFKEFDALVLELEEAFISKILITPKTSHSE